MNDINPTTPKSEGMPNLKQLAEQWNSIDWKLAEHEVNRLQTRIVKAVSENKSDKVRRLQYLLVHSFYAKAIAVRRVTTNNGKKTAGVDGEIWSTDASKMKAVLNLTDKGYKAMPLRRVNIPKKGKPNKTRPLGIPTMHDRAMQALYLLALEPVAETTADKRSFGFRRERCAQDAGRYVHSVLTRKCAPQWVLEGDIKGCFDHISHQWLMDNVPIDKSVLNQWLKAGFIEGGELFPTEEGTPQGGIISATLANMALDGIEQMLEKKYHMKNGKHSAFVASRNMVNFCRYADDFIVTAATKEIAERVRDDIAAFLAVRGLQLSEEKTLITHISKGFDFLGWNFRKYSNGVLIDKPSKKAVQAFVDDLHNTILRKGVSLKQDDLVVVLNRKILGWTRYHRHVCASKTFGKIEYELFSMLKRWAKRRHPRKGVHWAMRRYFRPYNGREWVFMDNIPLMNPQDVHIVRHPLLKLEMNPFLDGEYFEQRKRQHRYEIHKSISKQPPCKQG